MPQNQKPNASFFDLLPSGELLKQFEEKNKRLVMSQLVLMSDDVVKSPQYRALQTHWNKLDSQNRISLLRKSFQHENLPAFLNSEDLSSRLKDVFDLALIDQSLLRAINEFKLPDSGTGIKLEGIGSGEKLLRVVQVLRENGKFKDLDAIMSNADALARHVIHVLLVVPLTDQLMN